MISIKISLDSGIKIKKVSESEWEVFQSDLETEEKPDADTPFGDAADSDGSLL